MIQQRRNKFPWGYIQGCYSNVINCCCPITPSKVNFKIVFCTFNTGQHKHSTEFHVAQLCGPQWSWHCTFCTPALLHYNWLHAVSYHSREGGEERFLSFLLYASCWQRETGPGTWRSEDPGTQGPSCVALSFYDRSPHCYAHKRRSYHQIGLLVRWFIIGGEPEWASIADLKCFVMAHKPWDLSLSAVPWAR